MIEVLKDLAAQKLESAIKEFWDADEFMRTVQTIYNTTPPTDRGLRDLVVRWSLINMDKIADHGNFESMRAV
jgi:speckle-type POZ protein